MLKTVFHRLNDWRQHQDTIRRLRWLDDHLLDDIGATRDTLDRFVRDRQRRG